MSPGSTSTWWPEREVVDHGADGAEGVPRSRLEYRQYPDRGSRSRDAGAGSEAQPARLRFWKALGSFAARWVRCGRFAASPPTWSADSVGQAAFPALSPERRRARLAVLEHRQPVGPDRSADPDDDLDSPARPVAPRHGRWRRAGASRSPAIPSPPDVRSEKVSFARAHDTYGVAIDPVTLEDPTALRPEQLRQIIERRPGLTPSPHGGRLEVCP